MADPKNCYLVPVSEIVQHAGVDAAYSLDTFPGGGMVGHGVAWYDIVR